MYDAFFFCDPYMQTVQTIVLHIQREKHTAKVLHLLEKSLDKTSQFLYKTSVKSKNLAFL